MNMKMKSSIASNGMKKKIFGLILGSIIVLTPLLSFNIASAGIVPNCGTFTPVLDKDQQPVKDGSGNTKMEIVNKCDFEDLMQLINNVIEFLLFIVATPLVAIILCYAGFIMLTSGGSSEKVTKAKHIIKSVVFGYIIALAAWLIINTILSTLGFTGDTLLKQ
jgi:hypothetical protein